MAVAPWAKVLRRGLTVGTSLRTPKCTGNGGAGGVGKSLQRLSYLRTLPCVQECQLAEKFDEVAVVHVAPP